MKLVLVLVAVLWAECSGMTDLGSCTTVTDQQVCGDVTADPNGCSASVGWGDLYFSWNCNGEDLQCHRRCSDRLEQPDDCVGIETRCNLHDSHGVCEEFEGDCGFGSRDVTWDCGQLGLVGCPELCCCIGCLPSDSPIPQAQVCDDFYDELACACRVAPCMNGGTCQLTTPVPTCLCPSGYAGPQCNSCIYGYMGSGCTTEWVTQWNISSPDKTLPLTYTTAGYIGGLISQTLFVSIKSDRDGHILLAADQNNDQQNAREIVLGGHDNLATLIRDGSLGPTCSAVNRKGSWLSQTSYRTFWVTWTNGVVSIGEGPVAGQQLATTCTTPMSILPNFVAFSQYGNDGYYQIARVENPCFLAMIEYDARTACDTVSTDMIQCVEADCCWDGAACYRKAAPPDV